MPTPYRRSGVLSVIKRFFLIFLLSTFSWVSALAEEAPALRDPTQPLDYRAQGAKRPHFALQAVFVQGTRKVAIINGSTLQKGESLEGWRLALVRDDSVVMASGSERMTLNLHQKVTQPVSAY